MQEEIEKYLEKETYHNIKQPDKQNGYEESMDALIRYMRSDKKNPSEKEWDRYATCYQYLSSKTIGYLSGIGFNPLCRKVRKEINKKKRQT